MVGSTFKTMYLVSKSEVDNNTKKNFKLSLQNKDICNGGMSVSVKPIKTRKRNKPKVEKIDKSLKRSHDQSYFDDDDDNDDDDDDDDDDGENGGEGNGNNRSRQQNSKQKRLNFPSYGFRPQNTSDDENENKHGDNNANLFQRQLANIDQPKRDFYKFDPIKSRRDETKQLKRQRLTNDFDDRNNEQKYFVSDDQPKQDPPAYLDMEESSDDDGQAEKPDDNDDKKYIAHDKDQSSDSNRNSKTFESEENLTDESMNKSNDIGQFKQGVNIRKSRKRNKTRWFEKRKRIAHTKRVLRDQEKRERSFDRKPPIDLSNENKKHKFDNDGNNQPILEEINLKRRKILDDINKLKDDQWIGRIKSRLNDKRVQFKRKRDTVGYRINPDDINDKRARIQQTVKNKDDISKSLIKPSDFTYLNKTESADFLDKWRPLKELRSKPFTNKRFKPYR